MTSLSEIPPFGKVFLICMWVETALWGMNTVLFAGVYFVSFGRSKTNGSHWVLAITSLLLYLCATLHVSASLRQALEAFVYVPPDSPPEYASLYLAQEGNTIAAMKNVLYVTAAFLQDLVLIWRMYIVWECSWKIIVIPVIVEVIHIGCAYAATILLTKPGISIYSPIQSTLGYLGWPLEVVVNVCVSGAIVFRLWYMGHAVSRALSGSQSRLGLSKDNSYIGPILIIIESGAIIVAVSITMLVLYKTGNPAALMCLGIATQIAAFVPYLIVLRVGLRPNRATQPSVQMMAQKPSDQSRIRFTPRRFLESRSRASELFTSTEFSQRQSNDLSKFERRNGVVEDSK